MVISASSVHSPFSLIRNTEFDVRFEEAAVVEGAHVISARLVVEGDDPESLENWLAVGLGSPDSFDFQDQPIQFELGFFRLHQHERFPWSTQQASLSHPFARQETELLHRRSLRVQVRCSR